MRGAEVVVGLEDGRLLVGKVIATADWGVALRPWGRAIALRLPFTAIKAATLAVCTYAEAKDVGQRQAAGLPAWDKDAVSAPPSSVAADED